MLSKQRGPASRRDRRGGAGQPCSRRHLEGAPIRQEGQIGRKRVRAGNGEHRKARHTQIRGGAMQKRSAVCLSCAHVSNSTRRAAPMLPARVSLVRTGRPSTTINHYCTPRASHCHALWELGSQPKCRPRSCRALSTPRSRGPCSPAGGGCSPGTARPCLRLLRGGRTRCPGTSSSGWRWRRR